MALTIYTTIRNMLAAKVPTDPHATEQHMHLVNLQYAKSPVRIERLTHSGGMYTVVDIRGNVLTDVSWEHLEGFTKMGVDLSAVNVGQ